MLRMEVITHADTLLIALFILSMECCSLSAIPSKTTSECTQVSTTYPTNCIRSITTTIRAIGTKNIGLALIRCCSYRVQAINMYKYFKAYPKVSQRINLLKTYIFPIKMNCSLILRINYTSPRANWSSRPKAE